MEDRVVSSNEKFPEGYEHIKNDILKKLLIIEHSEKNALEVLSMFLYNETE